MDRENLFIRFSIKNLHTTKFYQMGGRCPRQGESCVPARMTSVAAVCGRGTMSVAFRCGSST